MGHDKLRKFAENETFTCLLQPDASLVLDKSGDPSEGLRLNDHPIKGRWNGEMFHNDHPIVLELGCGKGEYTIDLSRRFPECNYIGVDIKGARLWRGAKTATEQALPNVAFLRTRIEFIEAFFGPGEVSSIWLTFSDPQLKSENSRLTSPLFLERYRKFLKPGGVIHLKTDSRFLHEYSKAVALENGLTILASTTDLYNSGGVFPPETASNLGAELFEVQTFYERMFLSQGYKITYLAFTIDHEGPYRHPSDFDSDYWRSIEGPRRFSHAPSSSQR
ncbi:MAG: tRNA (guanosine(46)-N7)-methyltransferase TrmB [Bacteroidales bacterium]|jgi:Predicted S-adenosylmethionine-dependent methyltransferase|nr:tRNA (guanosine(46)-N7)-methyltransferase TrmB [Bacteroidales bacterium]